jgi:hypothetical protein
MTGVPEASLARELALCYTALALVTDHDAGVEGGEAVTHEEVLRVFAANMTTVRELVLGIVAALPADPSGCRCSTALTGCRAVSPCLCHGRPRPCGELAPRDADDPGAAVPALAPAGHRVSPGCVRGAAGDSRHATRARRRRRSCGWPAATWPAAGRCHGTTSNVGLHRRDWFPPVRWGRATS